MVVRPLTSRAAKMVQEARSMSTPAARKTTMGVSAMLAMMSMTTCRPSPAASRFGGNSSTAKRMVDEPVGRDAFMVAKRRLHECLQGVGFSGVEMEEAAHAGDFHHLLDHGVGLTDLEAAPVDLHEFRGHVDRAQTCAADIFQTRNVQQDFTVAGLSDSVQFGGGGARRTRFQPANEVRDYHILYSSRVDLHVYLASLGSGIRAKTLTSFPSPCQHSYVWLMVRLHSCKRFSHVALRSSAYLRLERALSRLLWFNFSYLLLVVTCHFCPLSTRPGKSSSLCSSRARIFWRE